MQRLSTRARRIATSSFQMNNANHSQSRNVFTHSIPFLAERSSKSSQHSLLACWDVHPSFRIWLGNWNWNLETKIQNQVMESVSRSLVLRFVNGACAECLALQTLLPSSPSSSGLCSFWSNPSRFSKNSSKPATWSSMMWRSCLMVSQTRSRSRCWTWMCLQLLGIVGQLVALHVLMVSSMWNIPTSWFQPAALFVSRVVQTMHQH